MLLGLFVLLPLKFQPQISLSNFAGVKISISTDGEPLPQLFKKITDKTKIPFEVRDEAQNELVACFIKDSPLNDAIEEIENATRTQVRWNGSTFVVQPDEKAIIAAHDAIVEERVKLLKARIDYTLSQMSDQPFNEQAANKDAAEFERLIVRGKKEATGGGDNDYYLKEQNLITKTPSVALFTRLLAQIPARLIVDEPESFPISFSPTPSPSQFPILTPDIKFDSAAFIKNQNYWDEISPKSRNIRKFERLFGGGHLSSISKIQIDSYFRGDYFRCKIYDEAGKLVILHIPVLFSADEAAQVIDHAFSQKMPKPRFVQLSILQQDWIKISHYNAPQASVAKAFQNQRFSHDFFHPERHNPIACLIGSILIADAKSRSQNLVAELRATDFDSIYSAGLSKIGFDVSAWENSLIKSSFGYAPQIVTHKPGWMIVKPKDPLTRKVKLLAWPILGQVLRRIDRTKQVTFQDVAAVDGAFPVDENGSIEQSMLNFLLLNDPKIKGTSRMGQSWPLMAFLGRLSSDQIAEAESGKLPLAMATSRALRVLRESYRIMNFKRKDLKNDGEKTIFTDPFDALPNGLPSGGFVHLAEHDDIGLQFQEFGLTQTETLNDFVHDYSMATDRANISSIRVAYGKTLTAYFSWPNHLSLRLSASGLDPTGKSVNSIDKLPTKIRTIISSMVSK